jgi:hypothetical protein
MATGKVFVGSFGSFHSSDLIKQLAVPDVSFADGAVVGCMLSVCILSAGPVQTPSPPTSLIPKIHGEGEFWSRHEG